MTEKDRLAAVLELGLLDTPTEGEYDEVVQLASELCSTPMSSISLIDKDRQWFKASVGMSSRETSREVSFCAHAIEQEDMLVVEDASQDQRFLENPLVTGDVGIRFYAGVQLHASNGAALGTLCVLDTLPRTLSSGQRKALEILGRQVQTKFALHAERLALKRTTEQLERKDALFTAFMDHSPTLAYIKSEDGRFVFYNAEMCARFKVSKSEWIGKSDADLFPEELARTYREHDLQVLQHGPCQLLEEAVTNGKKTSWKSHKFPFRSPEGGLMLAGVSVDISAEAEAKSALEVALEAKNQLATGLESSRSALIAMMNQSSTLAYLKAADGRYLFYNQPMAAHFGISLTEWLGKTDDEVRPLEDARATQARDHDAKQRSETTETLVQSTDSKGSVMTFRSRRFPIASGDGTMMLAGLAVDLTSERYWEKAYSEVSERLGRFQPVDELTGIGNSREFRRRLEAEFALANRQKRALTILLLEVDPVPPCEESLLAASPEDILRQFGRLLTQQVRAGDLAARIGGNEFAFLLPGTDTNGALVFADRISREADRGQRPISVSIGIAEVAQSTLSPDQLLAMADHALNIARRAGGEKIVVHDS